jgi:hypothetical protein
MNTLKTMCACVAVAACAIVAEAGFRGISKTVVVEHGATNTYSIASVTGKPVAISIGGSTNLTIDVATRSGFGLSLGGSKAIFSAEDTDGTNGTPATVYMYLDVIDITVTGSNGVSTVRMLIEE